MHGSQIFVRFALSLTVFEIRSTSCFEGHLTLTPKKCQNLYIQVLVYPMGPKFSSVSLYLLHVFKRDTDHFLFRNHVTLTKEKSVKLPLILYSSILISIPYGSQIFIRFALSLTVFKIRSTSCFEGHLTLTPKKCQNLLCIYYKYYYTLRVPNFRPFRSISYRFRDTDHFLFRRTT